MNFCISMYTKRGTTYRLLPPVFHNLGWHNFSHVLGLIPKVALIGDNNAPFRFGGVTNHWQLGIHPEGPGEVELEICTNLQGCIRQMMTFLVRETKAA
jgi:hypothetical protein